MALDHYRLGVAALATAGGGIASVPDGAFAGQRIEVRLPEDLGHQAHFRVDIDVGAVGGGDAGALLATVLKGEETEERQTAGLSFRHINPDYTTLFSRVVKRLPELRRVQPVAHGAIVLTFHLEVNMFAQQMKLIQLPF